MNTSHIMSGCCWLPLMKPITGRPVASSMTPVEAIAHDLLELHPLLDHCGTTPTVEQRLLHAEKPPRSTQTTKSSS